MITRSQTKAQTKATKATKTSKQTQNVIKPKMDAKADAKAVESYLKRKEEGVYVLRGVHYAILDGTITFFHSDQTPKNVNIMFLRSLKLSPNSDLFLELHADHKRHEDSDSFIHIVSNKYNVDVYGKIISIDAEEVTFECYEETIGDKENGTRTYDTDCAEEKSVEWKYVDHLSYVGDELPWWTDSEADSDEDSDEYSD